MNDRSAAYLPLGLREDLCEVVLDHPHLRVLGPPVDFVFVTKLYAGRAVDHDDLVALWPHCSFSSAVDAVAFYWNAYPHAPTDEHLASYVEQIAEGAGR